MGLEGAELTGVMVMLLVILPGVVWGVFPGEGLCACRMTVPVETSLPPSGLGLSTATGLCLGCGPRWMWILLSSVVTMLLLCFLQAACPDCCSGTTLTTVRASSGAQASATGVVLTVMMDTGAGRASEELSSGPLFLEMVVMVTGDWA